MTIVPNECSSDRFTFGPLSRDMFARGRVLYVADLVWHDAPRREFHGTACRATLKGACTKRGLAEY